MGVAIGFGLFAAMSVFIIGESASLCFNAYYFVTFYIWIIYSDHLIHII